MFVFDFLVPGLLMLTFITVGQHVSYHVSINEVYGNNLSEVTIRKRKLLTILETLLLVKNNHFF